MRSEIGQLTLDRTLAERAELNKHIVEAINSASDSWGIKCMRYEVCCSIDYVVSSAFCSKINGDYVTNDMHAFAKVNY